MSLKSNALVLSKSMWSESSLLITLISDKLGIIKAIAQGARKPKSKYYSQFELGNNLEIVLSKKEANIYKITDSTIIKPQLPENNSYQHLLSLQITLETYTQLVISEDEALPFYHLLQSFIDYLPSVKSNHLLINWRFLIRLAEALGFPIVYLIDKYEFTDKNEINKLYSEESLKTINYWLDILTNANKYITSDNILNKSCCIFNKFIFNWYSSHLHKKLHHNALDLYEQIV